MATTAPSFNYRCTSLNEAGNDHVNVTFVQAHKPNEEGAPTVYGGGNFVLTLPSEEALEFFPGQNYTLTLTRVAS